MNIYTYGNIKPRVGGFSRLQHASIYTTGRICLAKRHPIPNNDSMVLYI